MNLVTNPEPLLQSLRNFQGELPYLRLTLDKKFTPIRLKSMTLIRISFQQSGLRRNFNGFFYTTEQTRGRTFSTFNGIWGCKRTMVPLPDPFLALFRTSDRWNVLRGWRGWRGVNLNDIRAFLWILHLVRGLSQKGTWSGSDRMSVLNLCQ